MGSDFTTAVERPLSPCLNDGTFRAFLHDTHHAYLLLHRAFQGIPPTVIPDMVPTPHPGPEELDQPDYLRPTSSPVPSPTDEDEENEIFKLATGQEPPHRMATAKVPPPVRHFAAGRCGCSHPKLYFVEVSAQVPTQSSFSSSTSIYR